MFFLTHSKEFQRIKRQYFQVGITSELSSRVVNIVDLDQYKVQQIKNKSIYSLIMASLNVTYDFSGKVVLVTG